MRLYKLPNQQVLLFKNKAALFLHAYTTNTLDKPLNAFVNLQGKIVSVFYQKMISEDEVLVAMEKTFIPRLTQHLEKYKLFCETTFEEKPDSVYMDLDKKEPVFSSTELDTNVSDEEFQLFRLQNNIPLQGVDYDEELLLNVYGEEAVSYTKGCYLGQEIIARVHYRGKPPKKLVVKKISECTTKESQRLTSKTLDPKTGEWLGFVFVNPS